MTKLLGQRGEEAVIQYLQKQGFTILSHNYQRFFGEVDIIARHKNMISFIEVKTRKNNLVSMHELITPVKQRKIIAVAKTYITRHINQTEDMLYRFDVALVHLHDNDYKITYIPNAFHDTEY